jgi:hypothetical protein
MSMGKGQKLRENYRDRCQLRAMQRSLWKGRKEIEYKSYKMLNL